MAEVFNLTLTSVVFELQMMGSISEFENDLTLTSVVFEYRNV